MASIFRRLRAVFGNSGLAAEQGIAGLRIRPLGHGDLGTVTQIEAACFGSPWRLSSYARAVTDPSYHFVVAELDGELVAYAGFWVEGRKAHIAKLAVRHDYRRRRIASGLLEHLLDRARRLGLREAYLEVRRSNVAAQQLYERAGFHFERVQTAAYPDNGEDALVFVRDDLLAPKSSAALGRRTED